MVCDPLIGLEVYIIKSRLHSVVRDKSNSGKDGGSLNSEELIRWGYFYNF